MNEIVKPNVNRQPLERGIERAGFPETKERLTKTLGELVSFQTISDGKHEEQFRGLFDYVGERVARAEQLSGRKFVRQEWNNNGHLSTIITPSDPLRPDGEALLHPKIAMLIHADVVNAETEGMFTVRQEEDNLYGRGVYDMKQGLAMGLDLLPEMPVGAALVITSDEEIGGAHGAQFLAQEIGLHPEFLIVLDGQKSEHLSLGAKGVWHAQLTFNSLLNKGGHGSRHEDYSANELVMDVRNILRVYYPWRYSNSPAGTTFNVGIVEGGVATNKIAQEAALKVDLRFNSEDEKEHAREIVQKACGDVVEQHLHEIHGADIPASLELQTVIREGKKVHELVVAFQDTDSPYVVATIETLVDIPVYAIDDNDHRIRRFAEILEEITGQTTKTNDKDTGAHDGSKWPDVPAIVYMPRGGNAHKSTEWVSAESLAQTREAIRQLLQEELG